MAKKSASSKKAAANDDSVVRIKASSSAPKKAKATTARQTPVEAEVVSDSKATASKPKRSRKKIGNPFTSIGGYFKGAWIELRQVRWPTRRATWSFTGAVLVYTAFFVVLILLLDAFFKYLFELILGK